MNNANPYLPPEANLIDEGNQLGSELATRGQRLGASLLDTVINLSLVGPIMFAFGVFDYAKHGQTPPFWFMLSMGAIGFIVLVLVHGYFLHRDGQTIGKKILGIRIADLNNGLPPFARILALRYLPISIAGLIPVVGNLLIMIDVLFVFRSDRRCIHDMIAGTKVLQVKKPT